MTVAAPRRPDPQAWRGRTVLVTGHTGFKGSWLALMLARLGAQVHGLALDAPPGPAAWRWSAPSPTSPRFYCSMKSPARWTPNLSAKFWISSETSKTMAPRL